MTERSRFGGRPLADGDGRAVGAPRSRFGGGSRFGGRPVEDEERIDIQTPARRAGWREMLEGGLRTVTAGPVGALANLAQSNENTRAGAAASSFLDTVSFGSGDEIAGATEGLGAMARGERFSDAYHRRVAEARSRLSRYRETHPYSAGAGMLAGGVAAGVATGGLGAAARAGQFGSGAARLGNNALIRAAAGRGWRALGAQSILGSAGGALGGAAYGLGSSEGDLGERLASGNVQRGAMWGAALGAVSPAVFQGAFSRHAALRAPTGAAVGATAGLLTGNDPLEWGLAGGALATAGRPAVRSILNSNMTGAMRNTTGMSLGAPMLPGGGGARPRPPLVPEEAVARVDQAMGRARMGVDDLSETVAAQQADNAADVAAGRAPIDRRLADVHDEFSAEADTLANMPGESFTRARTIATSRASRLPQQLQDELRSFLGVTRSPSEALDEIRASARQVGEGYEQVVAQAPQRDGLMQLQRVMADPDMQPALRARFETEDAAARLATLQGRAPEPRSIVRNDDGSYAISDEATGRALHLLKAEIDDLLSAAADRSSMTYANRSRQGVLDDFRHEFLRAMDRTLPGYETVRRQRGDLFDAERALGINKDGVSRIGARILRMRPEEIRRRMQTTVTQTGRARPTTDFEREMIRLSVADEIIAKIDDYASARSDKTRNAGEVLDRVGLQNRLRAVFGDSAEVDQFLRRAMERAEGVARAAGWTGNSATARRASRAGDQFMAALARLGGGDTSGAAGETGGLAFRTLLGGHLERQNNAFGRVLLDDLDDDTLRALLAELRKMEQGRLRRASVASGEGLVGATGGGLVDEN